MRKPLWLAAAAVFLALPALAGTEIGTGDKAAWPEVKELVNLPSFSGKDVDGKVVLYEVFRTW
jgi:hypothetical protein